MKRTFSLILVLLWAGVASAGGISGGGSSGGGGGSPGGTAGNIQTNNGSGGFGSYSGTSCSAGQSINTLTANGVASACVTASGAPGTATYITQTPDAGLSAEQALSSLATGYVKNTTGTGVLSSSATVPTTDLTGTLAAGQFPALSGPVTTSAGSLTTTIGAGQVTDSMLASIPTATIRGRTTAGTGSTENLTGTQATGLLDVFTSGAKGLAPASGGGTTNYLRADGNWATPAGGGGGGAPTTSKYILQQADVNLTNAQDLSVLSSCLLFNTTATGVLSCFSGSNCSAGNVVSAINSDGTVSCTAAGSGTVTSTTMTSNTLPKATGASALANSGFTDDGTTGAYGNSGGFSATQFTTTGSGAGVIDVAEGVAPAISGSGRGKMYADSTTHTFKCSNNAGAYSDCFAPSSAPTVSVVTSDVVKNNNTTLGNITGLVLTCGTSTEIWLMEATLIYTAANTTPDIKVGWSVSNTTLLWGPHYAATAAGAFAQNVWDGVGVTVAAGAVNQPFTESGTWANSAASGSTGMFLRGFVYCSAVGGTAQMQFAQNTANASDLIVKKGSVIIWRKVIP